MPRLRILFSLTLVLGSLGGLGATSAVLAQAPAALPPANEYYPIQVGNEWTYNFSMGETKEESVYRIASVDTVDGVEMYLLESTIGGNVVATESLSVDDKGVHRCRNSNVPITPPVTILRNPVRAGDQWTTEAEADGVAFTVDTEISEEEVTVPAGTFKAVKSVLKTSVEGTDIESEYWFAPRVGMVRQVIKGLTPDPITIELTKFTLAERSGKSEKSDR
jgi:hypothetical protein